MHSFKTFLMESIQTEFQNLVKIRLQIFKNKYSGSSYKLPEWTNQIRIENIFRQLDRTCLYICQEPSLNTPENVALFTLLNSPRSWSEFNKGNYSSLKAFFLKKKKIGETVFHGAYMVNGPMAIIVNGKEKNLVNEVNRAISNKLSCEEFHQKLLKIDGVGDFIAHQIVINLQLKKMLPYDDSYVKLGPGSSEGLRILKMPVKTESLSILKELFEKNNELTSLIPKSLNKKAKDCEFTLETIENCLCIFQKMKKMADTGKTKRVYSPDGNKTTNTFEPEIWYK